MEISLSSVAEYILTGTFTRPKLMAPFHMVCMKNLLYFSMILFVSVYPTEGSNIRKITGMGSLGVGEITREVSTAKEGFQVEKDLQAKGDQDYTHQGRDEYFVDIDRMVNEGLG